MKNEISINTDELDINSKVNYNTLTNHINNFNNMTKRFQSALAPVLRAYNGGVKQWQQPFLVQQMVEETNRSFATIAHSIANTYQMPNIDKLNEIVLNIERCLPRFPQISQNISSTEIVLDDDFVESLTNFVEDVVPDENKDKQNFLRSIKSKMSPKILLKITTSVIIPLCIFAYQAIQSHIDSISRANQTAEIVEELKINNQKQDEILKTLSELTDIVQELQDAQEKSD